MEPFYNNDKSCLAVLVSYHYGLGWSTEANNLHLAYDKRIIKFYLDHCDNEFWMNQLKNPTSAASNELREFIHSIPEYKNVYVSTSGFYNCVIEWIPVGVPYTIQTYVGFEKLVARSDMQWIYVI